MFNSLAIFLAISSLSPVNKYVLLIPCFFNFDVIFSLLFLKVSSKISMTGEITLTGRVLPIGGLKEKVIGAHRANIKKIFIPKENEKDLDEIPKEIKKDIKFITVRTYAEMYKKIFK